MAICELTSSTLDTTTDIGTYDIGTYVDANYSMKGTCSNNEFKYTLTIKDYEKIIGESLINLNATIPNRYTFTYPIHDITLSGTSSAITDEQNMYGYVTSFTTATTNIYGNVYSVSDNYWVPKLDKASVLKAKLKDNLVIHVKTRSELIKSLTQSEQVAIETLREMISETEYRKFVKYGFILVRSTSGKVYQIFGRGGHIKVWLKGKMVEEICIRIKDEKVPKIDNLIAFKTMIETNEEDFRKMGNLYRMAA